MLLAAIVAATAVMITAAVLTLPAVSTDLRVPWWALVPLVYLAEMAVVHLRYRREAHSFSLSEIPLVIGLFFATPLDLMIAILVGNTLVMTLHRRQRGVKLAFNLAMFSLVGAVAIAIFRGIAQLGDALGPAGWGGAIAATAAGVVVAAALVDRAISLMGGYVDKQEALKIVGLASFGALVNTGLALIAVNLLWLNPGAAWLAVAPPIVVYIAYRSYVSQMGERARLNALYAATLDLHNASTVEDAMATAARHAREMVDAEFVELAVFSRAQPEHAFLTMSGPDEHEVVMRTVARPTRRNPWNAVAARKESRIFDFPVLGLGPSSPAIHDAMAVPLLGGDDTIVGILLAANRLGDVSSFTQDDLELLETLAGRTSVALENSRLEHSLSEITRLKDRLEGLVRSKDEFIASVSHELRTPLTAVVGLSQELAVNRTALEGTEVDELLGVIAGQSAELSYIVEDLLVAARADNGTLQIAGDRFEIASEVEDMIDDLPYSGHRRPDVTTPEYPIECVLDRFRLRQIVRNLLTNAGRYGGDDVWVEVRDWGHQVCVVVADNGTGVPEHQVDTIFEPYQRAHHRVVEPRSVGLGLPVARRLARLMDGDVVYVRSNMTTEFRVLLPKTLPGYDVPEVEIPAGSMAAS
jgi:signal transduction histidine kinase